MPRNHNFAPHNHSPNHLPRDVVEMQQRNPFGPPQSFESSQPNYTEHINKLVDTAETALAETGAQWSNMQAANEASYNAYYDNAEAAKKQREVDIAYATASAREFAAQNGGYEGMYGEKITRNDSPFFTKEQNDKAHAERVQRADTLAGLVGQSNIANGYQANGQPKKQSRFKRLVQRFRIK